MYAQEDTLPRGTWHTVHMSHAQSSGKVHDLIPMLHLDVESVEAGLPVSTMTGFVTASGIPLSDIYDVVIPARTLKHRRSRQEPLSRDESDKLARLIRIFDQAMVALGGVDKARVWLSKGKSRFGDRTPLQMLRTEVGGRLVEEMLGQIDEGMFA